MKYPLILVPPEAEGIVGTKQSFAPARSPSRQHATSRQLETAMRDTRDPHHVPLRLTRER